MQSRVVFAMIKHGAALKLEKIKSQPTKDMQTEQFCVGMIRLTWSITVSLLPKCNALQ